jgi:hypothetical protein
MTSVTPSTTAASHSTSTSGPNTSGAQLVLDGPNSSTYKSRVELKCISLPTAQRYIWKYNHVTLLMFYHFIKKNNFDFNLAISNNVSVLCLKF